MVNELQKLLELQADSIADIPLAVPFEVHDRSMLPDDFPLQKHESETGKLEKYTTQIVVEPQKTGTVFRMIPQIAKIDEKDLEKITVNTMRDFDESAPGLIGRYGNTIIEVICLGLHNRKGRYPDYMPEFLRENCTWKDLHFFLNAILFRMGSIAFINSTTLLKRMGPGAAETIALQKKNLESHMVQN